MLSDLDGVPGVLEAVGDATSDGEAARDGERRVAVFGLLPVVEKVGVLNREVDGRRLLEAVCGGDTLSLRVGDSDADRVSVAEWHCTHMNSPHQASLKL